MQKKEVINKQIKFNSQRTISGGGGGGGGGRGRGGGVKKKHLFISIATKIFDGINLPLYGSKAPELAPSNAGPMTASSSLPELH